MTKSEIRKRIKEIPLEEEYKEKASEIITEKVLASEAFQKAKMIFSYVSTAREPDTKALINKAFSLGKKVCVPRCGEKPFMDLVCIDSLSDLKEAKYGLMEPDSGEIVRISDADFAVIPCVSLTKDGVRLGHGGGYYDKFLEEFKGERVCLCYGRLMSENLPEEEHDIRVTPISEL